MGASTIEKGVLKLVHPGKHVEYDRRSITAAEIMKKNPRHCITRPESVMVPGKVFYIVRNKTVHYLMKNKSQKVDQPSPKQTESPNTGEHYKHISKEISPCKLWAGTTPLYSFGSSSCECTDSSPQVEERHQGSVLDNVADDSLTSNFLARNYYLNSNRSTVWSMPTDYVQEPGSAKHVKNFKSCMKKQGGVRVLPNVRVTFDVTTLIEY